MDPIADPPDSYYQREYPWLWEREWRENDDDEEDYVPVAKARGHKVTLKQFLFLWPLGLFIMVPMRFVWEFYPSTLPCVIFWAAILYWNVGYYNEKERLSYQLFAGRFIIIGMLCNALVTLANDGKMPVINRAQAPEDSIWILANETHQFLFLADTDVFFYCSLGDLFLLTGMLSMLFGWLFYRYQQKQKIEYAY